MFVSRVQLMSSSCTTFLRCSNEFCNILRVDSDEGTEWLRTLPPFLIKDNGKNTVFVEDDKHILEIWSEQRSEVKSFVYALVQSLDWLVQAVTDMKIRKVGGACTAAFHKGAQGTRVPGN